MSGPRIAFLALALAAATAFVTGFAGAAAPTIEMQGIPGEGPFVHVRFLDTEEWLDTRSGSTRRIDYGGAGGDEITVQGGFAVVDWNSLFPEDAYVTTVYDERDPWLEPSSFLLEVRRALASGRAQIVRSRATTHTVRFDVRSREAPRGLVVEVDVERASLLPLEHRMTVKGQTSVYPVQLERLRELPESTFRIDAQVGVRTHPQPASLLTASEFAARGAWSVRVRRVQYGDLARVVRFPVYTLGTTYLAPRIRLRFGAATVEERREKGPKFQWQPQVYLAYVRGRDIYGEPVLDIDEQATGTRQAELEYAAYPVRYAHTVEVEGKKWRIHFLGERGRAFALRVGRTLIQGRTTLTKAQLLRALASLRRSQKR